MKDFYTDQVWPFKSCFALNQVHALTSQIAGRSSLVYQKQKNATDYSCAKQHISDSSQPMCLHALRDRQERQERL